MLLFDPQTSGGLLLAVPRSKKQKFLERAQAAGQPAWVIGEAVEGSGMDVTVESTGGLPPAKLDDYA
jgi:selenide,water dikinase